MLQILTKMVKVFLKYWKCGTFLLERNAAKSEHETFQADLSVWPLPPARMCLCCLASLVPSVLFCHQLPCHVCPSSLKSHKRLRKGAVANQPAETVKVSSFWPSSEETKQIILPARFLSNLWSQVWNHLNSPIWLPTCDYVTPSGSYSKGIFSVWFIFSFYLVFSQEQSFIVLCYPIACSVSCHFFSVSTFNSFTTIKGRKNSKHLYLS